MRPVCGEIVHSTRSNPPFYPASAHRFLAGIGCVYNSIRLRGCKWLGCCCSLGFTNARRMNFEYQCYRNAATARIFNRRAG